MCTDSGIQRGVENWVYVWRMWGSGDASGQEPACQYRRLRNTSLGRDDPLEKGMATHSSILVWRIPMDRGAWQATVQRVAKSQKWLKQVSMHAWDLSVFFFTTASESTITSKWRLSGKESAWQCRRPGFNPWVYKIPWRRDWQPTPVFLPGKSQGQRSLVGYSPWGCKGRTQLSY